MYSDIYRPTTILDIKNNKDTVERLITLAKKSDESHIILKGYPGTGKKTLALLYLQEKYATTDVFTVKKFVMECKIPGKTDCIDLHIWYNPYFYYFSLISYTANDKAILDIFINNIISYKLLATDRGIKYRIIIIDKADLLSTDAQQSLRRTLETKIKFCRFIFITGINGHLIAPFYSRCTYLYVNAPIDKQIFSVLHNINKIKGNILTNNGYNKVINEANGNIKRALFVNQIYCETGVIPSKNDINDNVGIIVKCILKRTMLNEGIRANINNILKSWNPDINIILLIFDELVNKMSGDMPEFFFYASSIASKYDFKLKQGNKMAYYIEGYYSAMTKYAVSAY